MTDQIRDPAILVVDDDMFVIEMVREFLEINGFTATTSQDPRVALNLARSRAFDVVFLDIMMPEMDGIEVLRELRDGASPPEVVMMTARGDTELVVKSMKLGAFDYLVKPVGLSKLLQTLKNGLARRAIALGRSAQVQDFSTSPPTTVGGVVVASPVTHALLARVRDVARYFASILVSGPAGSGRSTWIGLLHAMSDRASGRIVTVDCKSLSADGAAVELFGRMVDKGTEQIYEPGAIKSADGGMLLLDNIERLPRNVQASLLSFMDTGQLLIPGLTEEDFLDVKIVVTTTKDVEDLGLADSLSEELLQRLSTIVLEVPPLAKRREEIPHLALHFAKSLGGTRGKAIQSLARDAAEILAQYPWPGEVAELQSMVDQAVGTAGSGTIELRDLPRVIRDFSAQLPYLLAAQFVTDVK